MDMEAVSPISPSQFLETQSLDEILASSSSDDLYPTASVSSDIAEYITHLTSLPLPEIEAEPTTLSSSSAQLTNALTTLCHTSYPTFLSLRSTTSTLSSSLVSLSSSLDALLNALPALETSAKVFANETREIQKERRQAALVLEHHDKLYDVLSLPILLDSCVRNHNYNEALLLANHATTLAERFPDNPLIHSVKAECQARVQTMLGQLLATLNEQAKLPALFRTVGFLRKMNVLAEDELALAFLTGRRVYLEGALDAVGYEKKGIESDKEAHARYLKRHVDVWRETVYDIVTQYTAIFLDRASSTKELVTLHTLLTTFTSLQIHNLLVVLRETLPLIPDPSLLTSLLTQLTYCANSFARVGLDFKALLAPIFTDAVLRGFTTELRDATEVWCTRLAPAPSSAVTKSRRASKKASDILVVAAALSSPPLPTAAQLSALSTAPPHVPPQILASYPPLATYTNALLGALNSLRLLAPVELLAEVLRVLDEALARGGDALLAFAHDMSGDVVVQAFGTVYFKVFMPFVRRALVEGVYGNHIGKYDLSEVLAKNLREWEAWRDPVVNGRKDAVA